MTTEHAGGPQRPHQPSKRTRPAMFVETMLFFGLVAFFVIVGVAYGMLTGWAEPVGAVALLLVAALCGLVGFFFWMIGRRMTPRLEDDPLATIAQGAGEYGEFSPHSWWPLVLGLAAAIVFLGVAVGWWICVFGVVLGIIGLVGLLFEFSRGQHAH